MPKAWIDPPNVVRDVAPGDPALIYHPDVAALYTTEVPDGTVNGATLQDGEWVNPPPPAPVVPGPPPEPEPPAVPATVTNFQGRYVMRATILPDGRSLETAVREYLTEQKTQAAVLPESSPIRIAADQAWLAWEQSNVFERNGGLINSLGPTFGFTPEQIDDLFRAAAEVTA